jgi:hypothetical protein
MTRLMTLSWRLLLILDTRTREGEERQLRSGRLLGGALREEMLDEL